MNHYCIFRALEYLQFRTACSVTVMICLVWFISATISMAPLIYTPWNFPFTQPENHEIFLSTSDSMTIGNRSRILSEYKCQVSDNSTFLYHFIYFLMAKPLYENISYKKENTEVFSSRKKWKVDLPNVSFIKKCFCTKSIFR